MNDNNLNNNDNNVGTYHATTNLNTAIENPQMNVNSATGINIKNMEYSSYADNGGNNNYSNNYSNDYSNNYSNNQVENSMGNSFSDSTVNHSISQNNVGFNEQNDNLSSASVKDENISNNDYQSYSNQINPSYSYEPVMKEKKRADDNALSELIHSKEFKVMVFIIFILVLFILVMPYIYDFFRELTMWGTA